MEQIDIDHRLRALEHVVASVRQFVGGEPTELRGMAALVDDVAEALVRGDGVGVAFVAGQVLSPGQMARLFELLSAGK